MKLRKQAGNTFPKGFTLIELLVVVLIVGILAAVALPQYNKAVEKARAAEAITTLNALQKGVDAYILENGLSNEDKCFLGGTDCTEYPTLVLDVPIKYYGEDPEGEGYGYSNNFVYYASCDGAASCRLYAIRGTPTEWEASGNVSGQFLDGKYSLLKMYWNGKWTNHCSGNCPSGLMW